MAKAESTRARIPDAPASVRDKIHSIEDLGAIAAREKAAGRSVVLCHGVFDLVHLGHVRHIEAARREGDVLIATCTSDPHVNRGPGRPVFTDVMRAEMLASLATVDYVGINDAATAEPLLEVIQPSVYIKGSEYENPEDDVTGKIREERELVERFGGRLAFTKEITFSSSSLLNRHVDPYEPVLRDFLDRIRDAGGVERLHGLIESVADMKVVLVGDTIIDEYSYVTSLGKASKENMVATLHSDNELFAGGVIAAARHVASFVREVEIVTTLGEGDPHEQLVRDSLPPNVTLSVVHLPGRPTTRKQRMVENSSLQKLFEVYFMRDDPLDAPVCARIDALVRERVTQADMAIVTDFGHGLIGPGTVSILCQEARFLAVNAQTNSGNQGYNLITKYPRADFICIDAPEARLAVSDRYSDIANVTEHGLRRRIDCSRIIVTHGANGCYHYADEQGVGHAPAFTKRVVDTVGAGDAFFVVAAPMVAAGANIRDAAFIGNAAGAMKVGIVGHRSSVDKVPLLKYIHRLLK